jgi:hypothetical protein
MCKLVQVLFNKQNTERYGICTVSNVVLFYMSKWFDTTKLVLNLDKTNIIKLIRNSSPYCALSIGH